MTQKRFNLWMTAICFSVALMLNTCMLFNLRVFKVQIHGGIIYSSKTDNKEEIDTSDYNEDTEAEIDEERSNSELTYYKTKPHTYTVEHSVYLESVDESEVYNIFELGERIYEDKSLDVPYKIKRIHF